MNRRQFAQGIASATIAVSTLRAEAAETPQSGTTPFPLSVMLWTVFTDLPFEERLAKIAEAGYTNVELVGEYNKWSEADYAKAIAAAKQHGIHFDTTAGLHNGVGNPAVRDEFLAELKAALTPMEKLSCPAMIIMSGNIVPGLSHQDQHASCIEGLKRAATLVEGKQIDGQPVRLLLSALIRKRTRTTFCSQPRKLSKSFAPSTILRFSFCTTSSMSRSLRAIS